MNKIFLIFAGSYAKSKINRISNIFYKAFNTNNQRSMVMVRPVIFSKDNISLRIKPIKGRYMVQEKNITLSDEGCMLFEFVNQMKDHEGTTQVNFNSKVTFRVSLSEMHKFFEIDPFINQEKPIELEYKKNMTGERKKLRFAYDKEKKHFVCELKVLEAQQTTETVKSLNLSETEMYLIQELLRISLPYLNGWHALASLSLIRSDLLENKEKLRKQLDILDNKTNDSSEKNDDL